MLEAIRPLFLKIYGLYARFTPVWNAKDTFAQQDTILVHILPFFFIGLYLVLLRFLPGLQKKHQILITQNGVVRDRKTGEAILDKQGNEIPKWELDSRAKRFFFVWNMSLVVFSGATALFCWTEFFLVLTGPQNFVFGLTCPIEKLDHVTNSCHHFGGGPHAFWYYCFVLSKFFELLDTVFVMIKNPHRKIILLQWYHHVSVLLLAWYSYMYNFSGFEVGAGMNTSVHTVMYLYYALAIYKKPSWGKFVTVIQILQMVIGLLSCMYWTTLFPKYGCCSLNGWFIIIACCVIYGSYLILFIQFFIGRYMAGGKKDKKKGDNDKEEEVGDGEDVFDESLRPTTPGPKSKED